MFLAVLHLISEGLHVHISCNHPVLCVLCVLHSYCSACFNTVLFVLCYKMTLSVLKRCQQVKFIINKMFADHDVPVIDWPSGTSDQKTTELLLSRLR